VTYKDKFETINESRIQYIAHSIRNHQGSQIVLVHGAGSFGHFQAKQFSLSSKHDQSVPDADWALGLCLTRNRFFASSVATCPSTNIHCVVSVVKLNGLIREILLNSQLTVTSMSPFPFVEIPTRLIELTVGSNSLGLFAVLNAHV
jgi:hypothetical protein